MFLPKYDWCYYFISPYISGSFCLMMENPSNFAFYLTHFVLHTIKSCYEMLRYTSSYKHYTSRMTTYVIVIWL